MVAEIVDRVAARRGRGRCRARMGKAVVLSASVLVATATATATAMIGAGSAAAATTAHITSVKTTGTPANPTIVVTGSGFGNQPPPNPSFHPEGHNGCPDLPRADNGFNFGNHIFFSDLNAARGMPDWTAGQANKTFFDCVGLIIDKWINQKIVFHFGNAYDKHLPENYYILTNGDPIQLTVNGATFKTRARF